MLADQFKSNVVVLGGGYRLRNKSVVDTSKKTNAYQVFNFSKHFVPMREYSSDCG